MTNVSILSPQSDQMNAGALVGRPDLSDDVLLEALRERLRARRRPAEDAEAVLAAAARSDAGALDLLRTVSLPAPVARLSMPTQCLTRAPQRRALPLPAIRLSWNRG